MLANPIQQGPFKTDVVTQPLGFKPLVLQYFLTLRQKLLIQAGLFYEFARGLGLLS